MLYCCSPTKPAHRCHVLDDVTNVLPGVKNVCDICTLLGFYAVQNGSFLPKFWDNLLVQYSRVKQSDLLLLTLLSVGMRHISVGVCMWHLRRSHCTR